MIAKWANENHLFSHLVMKGKADNRHKGLFICHLSDASVPLSWEGRTQQLSSYSRTYYGISVLRVQEIKARPHRHKDISGGELGVEFNPKDAFDELVREACVFHLKKRKKKAPNPNKRIKMPINASFTQYRKVICNKKYYCA